MLEAFFEPNSVAVIGASSNVTKLGHAVLQNLVNGGYAQRGAIYPINPNAKEILGYLLRNFQVNSLLSALVSE